MGTPLAEPKPTPVVDAGIMLRNPHLPIAQSLLQAAAVIAFTSAGSWLHDRLHQHAHPSRRFEVAFFILLVLMVALTPLMDEIAARDWIRVGPGGVTIGSASRLRRYAWTQIRCFDVQDKRGSHPPQPRAMLMLHRGSGQRSPDGVPLPAMRGWPPAQLVELLEEKRKMFS